MQLLSCVSTGLCARVDKELQQHQNSPVMSPLSAGITRAATAATTVLSILLSLAACSKADVNVQLGYVLPHQLYPSDDSVGVVLRLHRHLHSLAGQDTLIVTVKIRDANGGMIGRSWAKITPGQEGIQVNVEGLPTPLDVGSLSAEAIVALPNANGAAGATVARETFVLSVLPWGVTVVSMLPTVVTTLTREIVAEISYAFPAEAGGSYVLSADLNVDNGNTTVGFAQGLAINSDRGAQTVRVSVNEDYQLVDGLVQLHVAVTTANDMSVIQESAVDIRVANPEVDFEIVSINPPIASTQTTSLMVRFAVDQFGLAVGGTQLSATQDNRLSIAVKVFNADGDSVGGGRAKVELGDVFTDVSVRLAAGQVNTLSVMAWISPEQTPTWASKLGVARAPLLVTDTSTTSLTFINMEPSGVVEGDNVVVVTMRYVVVEENVQTAEPTAYSLVTMIKRGGSKFARVVTHLPSSHGEIAVETSFTASAGDPFVVLAFIVPSSITGAPYKEAVVVARVDLPFAPPTPVQAPEEPQRLQMLDAYIEINDVSRPSIHVTVQHDLDLAWWNELVLAEDEPSISLLVKANNVLVARHSVVVTHEGEGILVMNTFFKAGEEPEIGSSYKLVLYVTLPFFI